MEKIPLVLNQYAAASHFGNTFKPQSVPSCPDELGNIGKSNKLYVARDSKPARHHPTFDANSLSTVDNTDLINGV